MFIDTRGAMHTDAEIDAALNPSLPRAPSPYETSSTREQQRVAAELWCCAYETQAEHEAG